MPIDKKPAIKSVGVWGSTVGLVTFVYKIIEIFSGLDPALITDTQAFFIGTAAAFLALWGRWKAELKIGGLFKS